MTSAIASAGTPNVLRSLICQVASLSGDGISFHFSVYTHGVLLQYPTR